MLCYIGLIKRKIVETFKKLKGDICNERVKTAITKIALNENFNINYNKTKKIANYNYGYYACCEALDIITNSF